MIVHGTTSLIFIPKVNIGNDVNEIILIYSIVSFKYAFSR